jgi:hypothetical protein
VAYSGEKDGQKAAADNIERALKGFQEPHHFTHLIAPGLEHKQPPEWLKKCDDEYRKFVDKKPETPERVRFVTYTLQYASASWVLVAGQEKQYEKSVVDAKWTKEGITVTTANLRRLILQHPVMALPETVTIDGQPVKASDPHQSLFEKVDGQWKSADLVKWLNSTVKMPGMHGPIDDAFRRQFRIVGPSAAGWNESVSQAVEARKTGFMALWDKYFRGTLPETPADKASLKTTSNLILFGDPASNPLIAQVLPKLPITWTKTELVVNGTKYDPKTHYPVLIYPNPEMPGTAIVLNSGHTFGEADLKGTNALLFPKLGDWAVLKLAPTKDNPAGVEVVAAGLFDEAWQFPGK